MPNKRLQPTIASVTPCAGAQAAPATLAAEANVMLTGGSVLSGEYRYLPREEEFKNFAYQGLSSQFAAREDFDAYYSRLSSLDDKENFLRVASFYLFLVKRGNWHVDVEGSDAVVSYLTNSYKLAAIFSLIESLADEKHIEFHHWLGKRSAAATYPIVDQDAVDSLYGEYKEQYGSIRRCVRFFEALSAPRKQQLCSAVEIGGEALDTIKKLAQYLYNLRSKFVHEGKFAIPLDVGMVFSRKGKKVVVTELSIEHLAEAFEEGVLVHFGKEA